MDEATGDEATRDESNGDEPISDEAISDEAISDESTGDEPKSDEAISDESKFDEATGDEPNLDPAEAEARLDELGENIQQARRDAEEHGTLGAAADDDERRFVEDGDVDDEMNTQGVAPPA